MTFPDKVDSRIWNVFETGKKLAGYKSAAEVDRYISCWQKAGPELTAYVNTYRAQIQKAAEIADIPFGILACLYFRESRFDKNVKSFANPPAVGIAQLRPDTWKAMMNIIEGEPALKNGNVPAQLRAGVPKNNGALDQVVKKIEALYLGHFKSGKLVGRENIERLHTLLLSYQSLRYGSKKSDSTIVDGYLENTRYAIDKFAIKRIYDQYYAGKKKPIAPEATDPTAAIVVGAAYLKVVVFRGVFEKDHRWRYPSYDRWLIAVGAYNSGPNGSRCDAEMTVDDCIKVTEAFENDRHENSRHMSSIRNCSEHGNREPMSGDSGKGCGA